MDLNNTKSTRPNNDNRKPYPTAAGYMFSNEHEMFSRVGNKVYNKQASVSFKNKSIQFADWLQCNEVRNQ